MRVTTQMVNEAAREAGLPVNRVSLLNYVRGNGGGNDLVSVLTQKRGSESAGRTNERKLEEAAGRLAGAAEAFAEEGEDSLFEKSIASGDRQELNAKVEEFLDSCSRALKILQTMDDGLNAFYGQNLESLLTDSREALADIGITRSGDGSLELDREKLAAAETEKIRQALNGKGFAGRMAYLAGRIQDNAQAGARSLSTQYGADGSSYAPSFHKYDLWG